MTKKTAIGVFAIIFSVVLCLLYQATKPFVAKASSPSTSEEVRLPENQARPEEPAQSPKLNFADDTSAGSDESPVEKVRRSLASSRASSRRLLRQLNDAMQASDPTARDRFDALLAALVQNQPEAAGRFAESLGVGEMREEALRRVAQRWADQDPAGAERWAAQLSDQAERASALTDVCFQVAQTDAAQALSKAEQYGLGAGPGEVLENLAQQWAGQDFQGATNWVEKQPESKQRDEMLSRLALVQSQTAPAEAAQLVVDQIPSGPIQTEATISVLHQWAERDLDGAKAWVELFPAGPVRDRADTELANIAAYQNPSNQDRGE